MAEKIKKLTEKLKNLVKRFPEYMKKAFAAMKRNLFLTVGAAVLVVVLIVGAVLMSSWEPEELPEEPEKVYWGVGLTENIPEFDSESVIYDVDNSGYAAAYYSNVGLQKVNDYASKIETELGISFSSDEAFPRTAVYGENVIVIHYNVTEMKLSVTVAEKTGGSN